MNQESKNLIPRPPIVVVMGHIDHGKTTLLDYIRKSNVAGKESGGITQHIGAYETGFEGKQITFIDTPGHEAFSKMRGRGAKVADIAILVVAADDGVKPQTKEALEAIKKSSIPFVVAINKIDKNNADPERTKHDLAESEVFLEGRGGTVPYVEISAKDGRNVSQLLETVLLIAEMENISADANAFASGVVIESHRDHKRGNTSTLLILNGILKKGLYVVAGDAFTKIKILENFIGKAISDAGPSSPILIVGFDKLPAIGSEFKTFESQKEAEDEILSKNSAIKQKTPSVFSGKPVLGLVIKADVLGSAEAIEHEIDKLRGDNFDIKILRVGAGDIYEDDVKFASSSENPFIVAFKVSIHPSARELAHRTKVEIMEFSIIYEATDFLKKKIAELFPPEVIIQMVGKAQILKIFPSVGGKSQIVGGKVLGGVLKKGATFNLLRREKKIGEGKIENLQAGKMNISEVATGSEFGALCFSKLSIATGDILEVAG